MPKINIFKKTIDNITQRGYDLIEKFLLGTAAPSMQPKEVRQWLKGDARGVESGFSAPTPAMIGIVHTAEPKFPNDNYRRIKLQKNDGSHKDPG